MENDDDNDIDTLLEKSIDEIYPKTKFQSGKYKRNRCPFSSRSLPHSNVNTVKIRKVEEKTKFHNLLLPEGWIRVFHESGMYFYCHVATKVVTWSMPYEIQTEPARYHRVPVRSIPCLSVLSPKLNTTECNKLVNGSNHNPSEFHPTNIKSVNINDHIIESNISSTSNDDSEIHKEKANITDNKLEDDELDKEDGEIESSDENEINELSNKQDRVEPILPKKYRLNDHHSKSNRFKTLSASNLSIFQKNDEECTNPKRTKFYSDTYIHNSTEEILLNVHTDVDEPKINKDLGFDSRLLEPAELTKYCEKIFTFVDEVKYLPRFYFNKKKKPTSTDKLRKPEESDPKVQAVSSAETMVPLSCSVRVKIPNKNTYLDLAGRNFSCILNIYCQHAYSMTPSFKMVSSMSGINDYEVACEINNSTYGVGEGRTKKIAKQKAVIKTLEILIPGFLQKISNNDLDKSQLVLESSDAGSGQGSVNNANNMDDMYSLFDIMEITDPRVFNYTIKLNSISPYNLLTECMNRHCVSETEIKCKIEKQNKHNVFKLIIGEKEVETNCENKKEGRQLAAQYMLAKLHPHIQSWGGILRIYGPGTKPLKRFDMQEMQNLLLEDRGGVKNNLINLLRERMLDLNEEYQRSSDKSRAKFQTPFQNIPIIIFHPDSQVPAKK